MSGVILPLDHFGTHLDHNNKTIDEELELQNFEYAGEILAELLVVYCSTGIEWVKDDKETSYLSLSQNIALNGSLLPNHANTKFPKGVSYHYTCP